MTHPTYGRIDGAIVMIGHFGANQLITGSPLTFPYSLATGSMFGFENLSDQDEHADQDGSDRRFPGSEIANVDHARFVGVHNPPLSRVFVGLGGDTMLGSVPHSEFGIRNSEFGIRNFHPIPR